MDYDATSAFVDNALMVLCARHRPSLEETDELGDRIVGVKHDPKWQLVSDSLQTILRHPKTDVERLALRWVDVLHFNPAVCRHRAQYILWRQRRQQEERKLERKNRQRVAAANGALLPQNGAGEPVEVSDFNVLTSTSLKDEVDQLMSDVRSRLPVARGGAAAADSDDDSEEGGDVAIFRPPAHMLQDEQDEAQAEAEALLLQKVQDLQLEHYKKYHRWVETSYPGGLGGGAGHGGAESAPTTSQSHMGQAGGLSSNNNTPVKAPGGAAPVGGRSGMVSTDEVQDIPLDSLTTQNVSDLLDFLGIPEHKTKFRRTTGRLLLQLKKEDLRERFGEDFEAADILWTHIEENRVAVPSAAVMAAQRRAGGGSSSSASAATSSVKKLYEDARAPSSSLYSQTKNLKMFERQSNPAAAAAQDKKMQELFAQGDLSAIKRSLNPNRPPRPSAKMEEHDYSTSEDDMAGLGNAYLRGVQSSTSEASTPEKSYNNNNSSSRAGAAVGGGYAASNPAKSYADPVPASKSMAMNRFGGSGGSSSASPSIASTAGATTTTTSGGSAAPSAAAPSNNSRANRWTVVEYSDDDETEDDVQ